LRPSTLLRRRTLALTHFTCRSECRRGVTECGDRCNIRIDDLHFDTNLALHATCGSTTVWLDERDNHTAMPGTSGASRTVNVGLVVFRRVEVHH
jgi:hypothetical protein